MAKSRKKTTKAAKKRRPARTKRVKVSKRMAGTRKAKAKRKTAAPRRASRTTPRKKKPKGIVDQMASTMQKVVEAAEETSEMRQRMGARGGLSEG